MDPNEDFPPLLYNSYYMAPLLLAYDDHMQSVEKELKQSKDDIKRLSDQNKMFMAENDDLRERLELKLREYSRLVNETVRNSEVLNNFEEEKRELDDRCQLLSEENHLLLE
jgi:septal ring factor EnvC (AmiA/AmiB activator)